LREGVLVAATLFINAHLLDPDQGLDKIGQLRVEEGKIAAIGRHLPVCGAEVVDLRGQLLTPGWIDIHTHVFTSVGDFCLPADEVGIRSGVTTVVEAGITFPAFCATVASTAQTRVYALILLCSTSPLRISSPTASGWLWIGKIKIWIGPEQ
jgi:dihydroorotase